VRRPYADRCFRTRAHARMNSVETAATAHEGPEADALQPPLHFGFQARLSGGVEAVEKPWILATSML